MAVNLESVRGHVSEGALSNISKWLEEPKYREFVPELEALIAAENWQELENGFFKVLEFGTGGRRGEVGIGSNRINRVTIGESAQALCLYAKEIDLDAPRKGIVIACDTRVSSPELSKITAEVCAGNGFKTYIFENFRSTPELSFAVRHLGTAAGIVISASHNPPGDNGFKAYWNDGAQLVAPHDKAVLKKADEIEDIAHVDFDQAVAEGIITEIGREVDDAYVAAGAHEAVGIARDLHIVYSPLHGAGQTNVLPILKQAGFSSITLVDEQMTPDGAFPTIPTGKPNPEERAANDKAVQKLRETNADIAITNDPDADRIGVMAREGDDVVYLTGNQSAAIAADYVLGKLRELGELTPRHYLAKTIVTTDLLNAIADSYGAHTYDNMLIGFKYIGELIRNKENTDEVFVLGGEESYGLLKGTYARDKDGAAGALTLAEAAAELKASGKTLYTRLLELFAQHGIFVETLVNIQFPGADGFDTMQRIMATLRESPPKELGGYHVSTVQDYQTLEQQNVADGEITPIDCVSGNVLVFELGDTRRRITIRPSGTEPKLKFYIQWYQETNDGDTLVAINEHYQSVKQELAELSAALEAQLGA